MKIIKTSKENLNTARWSGGTTTELAIYPEDASYSDRNFSFRISTATIEIDHSVFTSLPGVSRVLMVLEGEIKLNHVGQYEKILKPFDVDAFEGGWQTESYGRATDFNLMTKGNCKGMVEKHIVKSGSEHAFSFLHHDVKGVYVLQGSIELVGKDKSCAASTGDFVLMFAESKNEQVKISSKENTNIVLTSIKLA